MTSCTRLISVNRVLSVVLNVFRLLRLLKFLRAYTAIKVAGYKDKKAQLFGGWAQCCVAVL